MNYEEWIKELLITREKAVFRIALAKNLSKRIRKGESNDFQELFSHLDTAEKELKWLHDLLYNQLK